MHCHGDPTQDSIIHRVLYTDTNILIMKSIISLLAMEQNDGADKGTNTNGIPM